MPRRIIRTDGDSVSVALESPFESEAMLHGAIAAHPEVLPTEDLGLGPLIPLATELDLGSGPMDLLASDPQGRLVVVEFKRGSENPDVRKVIAQVLDYGSSLWRLPLDELEDNCRRANVDEEESTLVNRVAERCGALGIELDTEAFLAGVEKSLESGDFVFLYVARDLDARTRRIMTYLADGVRMTFFAVEVDYFRDPGGSGWVLVPRTAFVPSWITLARTSGTLRRNRAPFDLAAAPPEVRALIERMDGLAAELALRVVTTGGGKNYHPLNPQPGVSFSVGVCVYASGSRAEINLLVFRELGSDSVADDLLTRIRETTGIQTKARSWPVLPCAALVNNWEQVRARVMEPYFAARADASAAAARPPSENPYES